MSGKKEESNESSEVKNGLKNIKTEDVKKEVDKEEAVKSEENVTKDKSMNEPNADNFMDKESEFGLAKNFVSAV